MGKINILVVEDESIVALDIKSRLLNLGYNVSALVSTGEEAVLTAARLKPDVILMDVKLRGEMDGIDAAEKIKTTLDIPVIYLTAYADEITLHRAKLTESYGYLLKPFEERELTATIETALYKHRTEKKLKENEQWLSTTLTSIGDAVIATNKEGLIRFMNPVAETLTGWRQSEALGKPSTQVFRVISEETLQPFDDPVKLVLEQHRPIKPNHRALLVARDNTKIPIDDSAAPISDHNNGTAGVVLVFRDITEQRQAEEKLRQYTQQLQTHIEELDAFAHTVAHDLQSPLGHIVSLADALHTYHKTMPNGELDQHLQNIVQNGLKMSSIIDSLLLLAGVRRKGEVQLQPLQMDKIVAEVEQRLSYMITEYKATINVPDRWPVALGYAPWIEEVWANYLSNAIKYGGRPPILTLGAEAADNQMIRFWVQDNGPGLSPEEQNVLFMPFTQLSQVQTKGHGLGLSIVRRIAEKLGGTVGVESPGIAGQGSRFYFTLPCAPNEP
ncbi:MAG: response regulator [Chloroflexi bacterium]|nr:MAG: response regulator [Chloroflexota bacterium]